MDKVDTRRRLFRLAHHTLYGAAIPLLTHTGPAEPTLRHAYWRVTRRPPHLSGITSPLDVDGLTIHYDPARPSYTIRGLAMGTYERATVELVRRLLQPGGYVIDLGAHVGYFSLLSASLVGRTGRVWAFEPDPDNRAMLERNVAANGFEQIVEISPTAISDKPGDATLYQYRSDGSSSSLVARYTDLVERVEVGVEVNSLDGWAASHGWPEVDLIKMDIEGAEGSALSGMTEVLRRNPRLALITEFNGEALSADSGKPESLLHALRDHGFMDISEIAPGGPRSIQGESATKQLVRKSMWEPVNLLCRQWAIDPGGMASGPRVISPTG